MELGRTVLGGRALDELVLLPGGAAATLLALVLPAVPIAVVIILRRLRKRSRLQSAMRKGSLKVQKSRERSPYPRAAAA